MTERFERLNALKSNADLPMLIEFRSTRNPNSWGSVPPRPNPPMFWKKKERKYQVQVRQYYEAANLTTKNPERYLIRKDLRNSSLIIVPPLSQNTPNLPSGVLQWQTSRYVKKFALGSSLFDLLLEGKSPLLLLELWRSSCPLWSFRVRFRLRRTDQCSPSVAKYRTAIVYLCWTSRSRSTVVNRKGSSSRIHSRAARAGEFGVATAATPLHLTVKLVRCRFRFW